MDPGIILNDSIAQTCPRMPDSHVPHNSHLACTHVYMYYIVFLHQNISAAGVWTRFPLRTMHSPPFPPSVDPLGSPLDNEFRMREIANHHNHA